MAEWIAAPFDGKCNIDQHSCCLKPNIICNDIEKTL